jgi:hypothetical protein
MRALPAQTTLQSESASAIPSPPFLPKSLAAHSLHAAASPSQIKRSVTSPKKQTAENMSKLLSGDLRSMQL